MINQLSAADKSGNVIQICGSRGDRNSEKPRIELCSSLAGCLADFIFYKNVVGIAMRRMMSVFSFFLNVLFLIYD